MPIDGDHVQETQAISNGNQGRIGQIHVLVLCHQAPHVRHIPRIEIRDQQMSVQDHSEQSSGAVAIGTLKKIGDLSCHRPGGDQQPGE